MGADIGGKQETAHIYNAHFGPAALADRFKRCFNIDKLQVCLIKKEP